MDPSAPWLRETGLGGSWGSLIRIPWFSWRPPGSTTREMAVAIPRVRGGPPGPADRRSAHVQLARSPASAWCTWPSSGSRSSAAGGAQGHQARHGHAAGDRPLRGRAAGAGDDGPSQHRPVLDAARPRRAGRTSSWSWSKGVSDHRVLRQAEHPETRRALELFLQVCRACSTPTRRGSSTAT